MKKFYVLALVLFVMYLFSGCASYRGGIIEVGGQFSTVAMQDYNDDIDDGKKDFEDLGLKADMDKITSVPSLVLNYNAQYKANKHTTFKFVQEWFFMKNESKIYWPDDSLYTTVKEDYDMQYLGFGSRYYFNDDFMTDDFSTYIGTDCGMMYSFWNKQEIKAYYPNGDTLETAFVNMSGGFFAVRLEAGINYMFGNFGLFLNAGGRYAKGEISGKAESLDVILEDGKQYKTTLDYTGAFITLGVAWRDSVGADKQKPSSSDDDLPELDNGNSYNELLYRGNTEYKAKRYDIASSYFKKVLEIKESASVYKKLGNCLYQTGDKQGGIDAFKKSLELNPSDTKLEKWLRSIE